MKKTSKYLFSAFLGGLVCLSLALPANAQHRDGGGGGGGGGHASSGGGGGGGGVSHSSGGGSSFSAPRSASSGSSSAPSFRSSNGFQRSGVGTYSPQRGNVSNGISRPGGSYNRGYISPQRGNIVNRGVVAPRAGVTNRGYVQGNIPSYRYGNRGIGANYSYRGGNYYRGGGHGYWPSHGYYHYYHGYYNSYYAPRLGFSIGFLPYGYYPFWFGDYQYYYSEGLFYQYNDNQYTVVEPPVGAQVNELPKNAQSIVINGQQYYEADGVYYQAVTKDDGTTVYEVAGKDGELNTNDANANAADQAPQIGDLVNDLPQDTRKIKLNGEKFYVSPDGYYYQDYTDQQGNHSYKIVGTPDDEPDGNNQ